MKKAYIKPKIIFEDFSLSTNIAGNCNIIINNQSENECGFLDDRDPKGEMVFIVGVTGCERTQVDDGNNGVCYHNPNGKNDLFNS